ncbi:hypothetical protein H6G65_08415 [Microcystis elabens FACHB-917]|nr:hypothetical protein [Microcystis elabens FACHB-917]
MKVELPLDPGLLRVIAAVQAGAQAQGLDPLLVGAAARDLLLVNVFGQRVRRLVFTAEGDGAGTTIDLVPFGGLQVNRHTLVWPPEMDVTMTVAGFTEALESAQLVELAERVMVKVASLPGLLACSSLATSSL